MVVKHFFPLLFVLDQYISHQNGMSQVSAFYLPTPQCVCAEKLGVLDFIRGVGGI